MTLNGYQCWDVGAVSTMLRVEAADVDAAVFFATHAPPLLQGVDNGTFRRTGPLSERGVLKLLLESTDFPNVAVTGEPGTGKSHLVRLLKHLTPPADEKVERIIINVPKYGMSLRSICEAIITAADDLETVRSNAGLQRAKDMLSQTRVVRDATEAALRLRSALALSIELLQTDEAADEAKRYCIENLPDLLRDAEAGASLLAPGGALDRLARLSMEGRTADDGLDDESLRFKPSDLPNWGEADTARMARKVKDFVTDLGSPELQHAALEVLNENLGKAKLDGLVYNGFSLSSVLTELRRALHAPEVGKKPKARELVLFIEDMTVIHGMERELEDYLTTRRPEGTCTMRVAFAVTEGELRRYGTLARSCHIVVCEAEHHQVDEVAFVGRYLNAVRLGTSVLQDALPAEADAITERGWTPNACTDCIYRSDCHDPDRGFGTSADGYGLYPFRPDTIKRASSSVTADGHFNPRALIKRVLEPVLRDATAGLAQERFPSEPLAGLFPKASGVTQLRPALDVEQVVALEEHDPDDALRRRNALELWGPHPFRTGNLPEVVSEALGIARVEALEDLGGGDGDAGGEKCTRCGQALVPGHTCGTPSWETALTKWEQGTSKLPSGLANQIRGHCLDATLSALRERPGGWRIGGSKDSIELLRRESFQLDFAAGGGGASPPVKIRVANDASNASIFKALRRAATGGPVDYAAMARWHAVVSGWADAVLRQVDPVLTTLDMRHHVENLVYLSRCTGADGGSDAAFDSLAVLLAEPEVSSDGVFTGAFRKLAAQSAARRTRSIVEQRLGAAKAGGSTLAVDAATLLPLVEEAFRSWGYPSLEGDGLGADLRRKISSQLPGQIKRTELAAAQFVASMVPLAGRSVGDTIKAVEGLAGELERQHRVTDRARLPELRMAVDAASAVEPQRVRDLQSPPSQDSGTGEERRRYLGFLAQDLPDQVAPVAHFADQAVRFLEHVERVIAEVPQEKDPIDLEGASAAAQRLVDVAEKLEK